MHSSENARRSQRRRPDLNINTQATKSFSQAHRDRDTHRDARRPQTPPNPNRKAPPPAKGNLKPGTANRALKAPSRTMRDAGDVETFLDMITPVDMSANKENDRPLSIEPRRPNPRDSHDLSLPSRHVRDSLMSNMLLSFDQFSLSQANNNPIGSQTTFEEPLYSLTGGADMTKTVTATSRPGRSHAGPPQTHNSHGYTYSSDFEGADDSSRMSSTHSRGRRSNSSSGFQSSLGRINSMRESLRRGSHPETPRMLHSRGGKGSKSSSTNSIDAGYAQVLGSQRWAQGFGGRSSSFDYGQRPSTSTQQPWHVEFSNTFLGDGYDDAAPTPTVPGGPRRLANAPSMPSMQTYQPPPPPPPEPVSEPKSPSKSDRKYSMRSSRSATTSRQGNSRFNNNHDVPPVPAIDLDSAPAPHVGYEKSKEAVHGGPNAMSHPPKDRPGFFRRVFGGFRDTAVDSPTSHGSNSPYVSSTSVETVGSRGHQHVGQMKSSSTPPSRESHHSSHHSSHGTLQKKPSSFFRRRKKSVTEVELPPPMPAPLLAPSPPPLVPPIKLPINKAELLSPKAEPSPVTSLRRAMNPYLKGSPTTPGALTPDASTPEGVPSPLTDDAPPPMAVSPEEKPDPIERNVRGFSPDYEPPPSATIRPVEEVPEVDNTNTQVEDSHISPRHMETPTRSPPAPPHPARTGSFLNDNSDSEDSPRRMPLKPSDRHLSEKDAILAHKSDRSAASSPLTNKSALLPEPPRTAETMSSGISNFVTAEGTDDDDDARGSKLILPIEGAVSPRSTNTATSGDTVQQSVSSQPLGKPTDSTLSLQIKDAPPSAVLLDEPEFVLGDPTEDDRQKAQRIFDGNEDFIQKEKAAAWMGEEGVVRQRTLRAYMDLYNFGNLSIVGALRQVCGRLALRAETQQVDRILVSFSRRWCECNPNHGFKSIDVIHTMCYSIMLLNTDLHLADIEQKMTRGQFIKNTMTTIRQSAEESAPDAFERPSILPGKNPNLGVEGEERPSMDREGSSGIRASFVPPLRAESSMGNHNDQDDCGPLVKAPFDGNLRAWEAQVEIVLKDTYASIRDERLPLFGAESSHLTTQNSGLSVMSMLKRSPSVLSKAPSEAQSSTRGRISEAARATTGRWSSKSRSRPRIGTGGISSSRTSFDDNGSVWSPTVSSATWSRYSLGRTQTSMSVDSVGSSWPRGDYKQSIGFANALSQAIVREDVMGSSQSLVSDELKPKQLLDDESLELAGPPWVKEGIVIHKHHLDGIDRKAKDRNWSEVFAVIQKGYMSLFSFSPNKSMRSKGRKGQHVPKGAVVGGGNWQENATNLGTFTLKQTIASALPPPGYSRQRPHVWALSLPTGAVHLFQVGTPEISKEFVTTANYWSARLSTHPLVGGISNIEYGWSESIVNNALVSAINESTSNLPGQRPGSAAAGRASMQSRSSFRSGSFEFGHRRTGSSSGSGIVHTTSGNKLPGDRIHIAEWTPPTQSLRHSDAPEPQQLQALLAYVKGCEEDLQAHNALRSPMLLAFSPRSGNAAKAMANWERRSSHLLREIVKFRTYVDCLLEAERRRSEIYKEREVARRAARGEGAGSLGSEGEFAKEFGMKGATEGEDGAGDETIRA